MTHTTLRDLAPWTIILAVILAGVWGKEFGADAAYWQLLSTVAGICGGAVVGRPKDTPVTTVTAGDPPTVTTGVAQ